MTMNRRTQNQLPHRTMRNGQLYPHERLQAPTLSLTAHTNTISRAFKSRRQHPRHTRIDPTTLPKS